MATQRCYYEILGIERNASADEVASAYRRLAVKYHPDKNPGDEEAISRFKECSEAFEVLHNTDKRSRYDRFGHAGVSGNGQGPQFHDVSDIFSAFGDIFGDLFGGGGGARRRGGRDVRCDVTLTLHEAAAGCTKKVEFQRHETCDDCQGSGAAKGSRRETCGYCGGHGRVIQSAGIVRVQTTCPACGGAGSLVKDPCRSCKGKGQRLRKVQTEVKIPAGVDDGMRVRIPGEGEPSLAGGPPGDCYCFVSVLNHPLFEREGPHLICRIPITYPQAALGCKLEVPTLNGREELEIPRGTQSGAVFRLGGKGMRDPRSHGLGDLLVQVTIEVPDRMAKEEEDLLRQLAELEHKNVTPKRKSFFEQVKDYFTGTDNEEE